MILDIKIPESLNDLTLLQWQKIMAIGEDVEPLFYIKRILSIVYNIKAEFNSIKESDIELLTDAVRSLLVQKPVFKNRFMLDGVEYGFIPNLDKISFGEFIDLDKYTEREDYNKLMSILFRPIIKSQVGDRYKIEKYGGSYDFNMIPLGIALGAVTFFLTLGEQLTAATLNSLTEGEVQQAKRLILAKNGGGIPASTI